MQVSVKDGVAPHRVDVQPLFVEVEAGVVEAGECAGRVSHAQAHERFLHSQAPPLLAGTLQVLLATLHCQHRRLKTTFLKKWHNFLLYSYVQELNYLNKFLTQLVM